MFSQALTCYFEYCEKGAKIHLITFRPPSNQFEGKCDPIRACYDTLRLIANWKNLKRFTLAGMCMFM